MNPALPSYFFIFFLQHAYLSPSYPSILSYKLLQYPQLSFLSAFQTPKALVWLLLTVASYRIYNLSSTDLPGSSSLEQKLLPKPLPGMLLMTPVFCHNKKKLTQRRFAAVEDRLFLGDKFKSCWIFPKLTHYPKLYFSSRGKVSFFTSDQNENKAIWGKKWKSKWNFNKTAFAWKKKGCRGRGGIKEKRPMLTNGNYRW